MGNNTKRLFLRITLLLFIIRAIALIPVLTVCADTESNEPMIVVSLGDSYSSGEGIEPFYDQRTEKYFTDEDWLAHRSAKSWPSKLVIPGYEGDSGSNTMGDYKRNTDDSTGYTKQSIDNNCTWYFVAASGATTENINSKEQEKTVRLPVQDLTFKRYLPKQMDVFQKIEGKVDYVTITIGGNDVEFAGLMTTAALHSNSIGTSEVSNQLDRLWRDIELYKARIRKVYLDIAAAAPEADIIVAGYPQLLDPPAGGTPFSPEEVELINKSVSRFNNVIEELVNEWKSKGMKIHFVDVEEEFLTHGAYSKDPWINPVMLGPRAEDLDGKTYASSYSIHPNEKGAEAYARCVNKKISELEEQKKAKKAGNNQQDKEESESTNNWKNYIGKSIINGKVVDSETGKPLKDVKVECSSSSDLVNTSNIVSVITDDNGHFKIEDLLKGRTILTFTHEDYEMKLVTKEIGSSSEEYDVGTIDMRKKGQKNKKNETDIIDDKLEIYVGVEYNLDYVIEGKDKKTTWTSSDGSVATVSKKGKVKALKPGNTTITLEANNKSDSALISVLEPYIEADNLTINKGESKQLPYKIFGPKEDIKFSSADKTIASIDKQGVVTGHQAGNTQITLNANNVSTTVVVTVEEGNAWAKYIDENYAPELGYASLDSASKTVGQNWNYPSVWDKRRGILGAQTADLNYDGIDECVLYYFDTKYVYVPGGNTITNDPKTTLYARVLYNNQNGEVVATPGRQIFFCDSISFCDVVGGILDVEGLKFVYFEVNTSGYYSNFGNTMYSFFTFDGKNFSSQMAVGKTGGGSSELEYGIIRSDKSGEYNGANVTESSQAWYWEDGKYSKQLLCVDRDWHGKGGQPLMNNFDPEDAMRVGLESLTPIKVEKIKLKNGPLSSYPTYRNNDAFSQGIYYNCNGRQGNNGARAMKITVEDNTGLRNYVTQSDDKAKQPKKSEKNENSEYILPFSSERYLTEADLDPLSEWELKLARNEIYARHGRRFKDPELQKYFDSKSWYKGIYDPQDFDKNHDSDLSELEKKNAEFILKYEKDHNYFT